MSYSAIDTTCSAPLVSELLRGKIGRVDHVTQSFEYAKCIPCYIVVLVQDLLLVIVDVVLPNRRPGGCGGMFCNESAQSSGRALFALHAARLGPHDMQYLHCHWQAEFASLCLFFPHPVLQFQSFVGLLTKQWLLFM